MNANDETTNPDNTLPFHLPERILAAEVSAHLSAAAVADDLELSRLAIVAHTYGYDLDVDLALIAVHPTPRAALRRLALSLLS